MPTCVQSTTDAEYVADNRGDVLLSHVFATSTNCQLPLFVNEEFIPASFSVKSSSQKPQTEVELQRHYFYPGASHGHVSLLSVFLVVHILSLTVLPLPCLSPSLSLLLLRPADSLFSDEAKYPSIL
eukprot:GHVS01061094.1.p1 GENE.GHVS01061094.1~~GHVS01061094.1.p1  ORF type:complete len:126 (-),score=17.48 GHVS01061094.1:152-529(-)